MLLLCYSFLVKAQTTTVGDDFEGNGTISTWYGDACSINIRFDNPYHTGINTSSKVLEYIDSGGQYANVRFDVPDNFDLSTDHTFSLKIYVPSDGLTGSQAKQVSLKLQDGRAGTPWSTQSEIIKPIILDQWQLVSFNFKEDSFLNLDPASSPPVERSDFNRVVIQVNGENNTDHVRAYIDDFYYDGTISAGLVFDQLVWSDEFDNDGALNGNRWFHQTQLPSGGSWYNGEVQHYTDRTENSVVEEGVLKIIARKESFSDQGYTKEFTSARLNSKFYFQYGKVEVRAKLPAGDGTWPAIWLLGKNINEDGAYWDNLGYGTTPWPQCGEIDIMEHWGSNQDYVQSATHTPSSYGGTVNKGGQTIANASAEFHIYTLEWSAEKLIFGVDGKVHYIYNPPLKNAETWPFDSEQYLLLNVAILPSINGSFTSSNMEIDYVRIYKESPLAIDDISQDQITNIYPNPFINELNINLKKTYEQDVDIRIYGIDGRLINIFTVPISNNKITFNGLGYLRKGIYILSMNLEGQNHTFKIIRK